jgi:putative phage-type endonuclease
MTGLAADLIDPPLVPGSPEWQREITASKVAAILGLSPWTSRFTVYHELAGMLPRGDMTVNQARGHYLEEAIGQWFADQYSVHLRPGKCWRSKEHPWMVVSPDRLVFPHRYSRTPQAVVEIKTSGSYDGWGPDGSDEIPPYYRCQLVMQMDALGLSVGHLAVLLPRLSFRGYTIWFDREEAAWMRKEVLDFVSTLPGGPNEQIPDIDATDSTFEALRQLNPLIEDREVVMPLDLARRLLDRVDCAKAAKEALVEAKNETALLMGNARKAVVPIEGQDSLVIATRTTKGGGTPYVAPSQSAHVREVLGV